MYYFSLDSEDYTCYPDEKEILLQAGLIFDVVSIHEESVKKGSLDKITIIKLRTSERKIKNYNRCSLIKLLVPFIFYFIWIFQYVIFKNWPGQKNREEFFEKKVYTDKTIKILEITSWTYIIIFNIGNIININDYKWFKNKLILASVVSYFIAQVIFQVLVHLTYKYK